MQGVAAKRFCRYVGIMDTKTAIEKLDRQFDKLATLNPDREDLDAPYCIELAIEAGTEAFDHFRERTEQIIEAYAGSPVKGNENTVVQKYLNRLDDSARQLAENGEIHPPVAEEDIRHGSVALAPRDLYKPMDWIAILLNADIPRRLARAVDAATERNRLVDTVLPVAFGILHTLDDDAAFRWELDFLDQQSGQLDSDVVRDLVTTWRQLPELPSPAIDWAMQWSMDETLERQWPGVVAASDRLLRQRALQAWFAEHTPKRPGLRHLQDLMLSRKHGEKAYARWLDAAVADVGNTLKKCIGLRSRLSGTEEQYETDALKAGMLTLLKSFQNQFVPVLLLADLLIKKPDGVYWLALATLGISHTELRRWRVKLQRQAYDVVQNVLLEQLRTQTTPEEIIRKLTFGDKVLAQTLMNRLDLMTKEFESIEDRNAVAEALAINYASFRENDLLAKNLTGRYRQVMSLLHEDTLPRLLPADAAATAAQLTGLREMYSIAGDARRYLNLRRSTHLPAERVIGGELDFARQIRRQRFRLICQMLEPQHK